MSNRTKIILLLLFLFAFRTLFGLSLTFFGANEIENDALQTYLIGLKAYTTGTWPTFGPDQYNLATGFRSQIPGALEGCVIGLPFYLLPIPEAPFLLLNLLSLAALVLLSWYIHRRLPELSFPFVLTWIALLPWTLNRSTHVFNPSYLLLGSILFFVGFLEALPVFSLKLISPRLAFGMMGFGLFWNMQFHGSWVLLPIYALGAFLWRRKTGIPSIRAEVFGFASGAILPLAFLLPTLFLEGFRRGTDGFAQVAVSFNPGNFKEFFTILARYLSLACYEMPRFLGSGTGERKAFFEGFWWLAPPALFLTLVGWAQPFYILIYGWFRDRRRPEAVLVQVLTLGSLLWVWFCFWFTSTGPAAHMYYVFLPLTVVGYFYAWSRLDSRAGFKFFALTCLGASLWFQSGYMIRGLTHGESLYSNRAKILLALEKMDYRLLAERRPGSFY